MTEAGAVFVSEAFLATLSQTNCIGPGTGWNRLADIDAPAFIKTHSHGEFVFDWMWAKAAEQAGIRWYPKLLIAAPFSPVTGPRLSLSDRSPQAIEKSLNELEAYCHEAKLTNASINFVSERDRSVLTESQWLERFDWQYHWYNRDYACFDEFLASLKRKARKNIQAERRKAQGGGWLFSWHGGQDADHAVIDLAFDCYLLTHKIYGNHAALSRDFFHHIARALGTKFQICQAAKNGEPLAAAIFFVDNGHLYGRYWGSLIDTRDVHFEVCYYQGIEYCIKHNLRCFEPGAQGEHKIRRGFVPTKTYSFHWFEIPELRRGIERYLTQEAQALERHGDELLHRTPYLDGHHD